MPVDSEGAPMPQASSGKRRLRIVGYAALLLVVAIVVLAPAYAGN